MPLAISVVPSTGSTATSQSGPSPLPTSSPLNSMGASSFSPSPITTTPRIDTVETSWRIASTAAPSPPILSPRPTQRPAAIAAASGTRTSSIARLRSGASRRLSAVDIIASRIVELAGQQSVRYPLKFPMPKAWQTSLTVAGFVLHGRQSSLDAFAGAFEMALTELRELLALLPQRERLLEGQTAGFELADDLDEAVPGLLVAEFLAGCFTHAGRSPTFRLGLCAHTTALAMAWSYPTNARANSCPSPSAIASSRFSCAPATRLRCPAPSANHQREPTCVDVASDSRRSCGASSRRAAPPQPASSAVQHSAAARSVRIAWSSSGRAPRRRAASMVRGRNVAAF